MWFLKADDERVFYIRGDKPMVYIGRSGEVCDLVLAGDGSVSRRHAVLRYELGHLTLQDLGSKYGTFVNGDTKNALKPDQPVSLNPNDRIKFGLNAWTLHKVSFVTCTSTVKGENLEEIKNDLCTLGGSLVSEWDEACTHLTMPAITLTLKVLAALAFGRPIVTAEFWKAWCSAVTEGAAPPDPALYLPKVIESTLNTQNVSFAPDERRGRVFAGRKFIFFSRKQMNFYRTILEQCGASVALLKECKLTKSKLCSDNVLVVQFSGTMLSQETQSQRQFIDDLIAYMADKSCRVIPELEIGLAILFISTEKYCNPKLNFMAVLNPRSTGSDKNENAIILAPETQEFCKINKTERSDIVIEESMVSMNNDGDCTALQDSECSQEVMKRTKRKLNDSSDTSNECLPKKPALGSASHMSIVENDMFNFVEDVPKTISHAPKKLSFMKVNNRKNENIEEENIFNFLPDKKEKEKPTIIDDERPGLFSTSATKRKTQEILCHPKKSRVESPPPPQKCEVKVDISQLLKNSFWRSCAEEMTKREMVKNEVDESEDTKTDLGRTVVSVRPDLVIKNEVQTFISNNLSSGPNFKRFKKVIPLRMQITVITSSINRQEGQSHQLEQVHNSSDEDEKIWNQNTKKGRKRGLR